MTYRRLKFLLTYNDGGVWGEDPTGVEDTIVLRSTEQTVDGKWQINDPAVRSIPQIEVKRRRLEVGDLVVTKSSGSDEHIGKASFVDDNVAALRAVFSNFNQRLRVTDRVNGRYVWHLLNSRFVRHHYMVNATSTSGLGNLTAGIFGEVPVPIVDLSIQAAIANFLDQETIRIDQLIEKREHFLSLIEEKKVSVAARAVSGALLEAEPGGPSGWFGTLPRGWKVRRAKFLFQERQSRSHAGEEELLTVSHITGVTKRSEKDVNMFLAESNEGYKLVSRGDVVINTMWAWMGAMGVSPEDGLISPSYGVYTPTTDDYEFGYLDSLLRSRPFVAEATRRSKGIHSSRLRLYPDAFLDTPLPVGPKSDQLKILEAIDAVAERDDKLAALSQRSLDRLREFRSALITAAVTGQINVATWGKRGETDRRIDRIEENLLLREASA